MLLVLSPGDDRANALLAVYLKLLRGGGLPRALAAAGDHVL